MKGFILCKIEKEIKMKNITEKHFEEFVAACHKVAANGLVQCSSGNLSWRVNEDHMLITVTSAWMANLTREQIVIIRISDGKIMNDKKPSSETGFHLGIMQNRRDVNAVLHFQAPCATAFACCATDLTNFFIIPEIPYYIGQISALPYLDPGSESLAEAVITAIEKHDLVTLKNHGQVTVGKNFDDVIQKATFFELACEILLRLGNLPIQFLSTRAINRLRKV